MTERRDTALRLAAEIDAADHMVRRDVAQDNAGESELVDTYIKADDHNLIVEALQFFAAHGEELSETEQLEAHREDRRSKYGDSTP